MTVLAHVTPTCVSLTGYLRKRPQRLVDEQVTMEHWVFGIGGTKGAAVQWHSNTAPGTEAHAGVVMLQRLEWNTLIDTCTNLHTVGKKIKNKTETYRLHDDKVPLQTADSSDITEDFYKTLIQELHPSRTCKSAILTKIKNKYYIVVHVNFFWVTLFHWVELNMTNTHTQSCTGNKRQMDSQTADRTVWHGQWESQTEEKKRRGTGKK